MAPALVFIRVVLFCIVVAVRFCLQKAQSMSNTIGGPSKNDPRPRNALGLFVSHAAVVNAASSLQQHNTNLVTGVGGANDTTTKQSHLPTSPNNSGKDGAILPQPGNGGAGSGDSPSDYLSMFASQQQMFARVLDEQRQQAQQQSDKC